MAPRVRPACDPVHALFDALIAHPAGDQLLATWWRLRQTDPAMARYLAGETLAEMQLRLMRDAIDAHGGHVRSAAITLGISYSTLYRELKKGSKEVTR